MSPSDTAYNTLVGSQSGNALTTGTGNTLLGCNSGTTITTGQNNCVLGYQAMGAITTGNTNICIGYSAGSQITTGSNNTIIGNYAGSSVSMSNSLVLADGNGGIRLSWENGSKNGIQSVDTAAVTLSVDNTMALQWNSSITGMNLLVRMGGTTSTIELCNERPINATSIGSSTTLAASHRNRFTQVTNAATITLVAYTGIVLASEHEFMNNSSQTPEKRLGRLHIHRGGDLCGRVRDHHQKHRQPSERDVVRRCGGQVHQYQRVPAVRSSGMRMGPA